MAKNIRSANTQLNFDTRYGEPVMTLIYAGLKDEHKMPDGTPSAWAVSFAATRNGYFIYNRVIYVRQCNIRPLSDGKLVENLPVYHAAVVFMMANKLSHVLLIKDDSTLVWLLKNYNPATLPCADSRIMLCDYWQSVKTSQIYALESPEQSDVTCQNFQCTSLPGWYRGETEMREAIIELSECDQKVAYEEAKTTVIKDVDYALEAPGLKMVLHHDYVYTDYERKITIMTQKDAFL